MIFWYSAIMLGIEAVSVINTRVSKMALGQLTADETSIMLSEKFGAAFEAFSIMARSGDADAVIKSYRQHVTANVERLR